MGTGCPCRVSIPARVLGARTTALLSSSSPGKFSRGQAVNLPKKKKKKKFWNLALERYYMGNEKDVLAGVFSYRNEHDREGDALTTMKS